MVNINTIIKKRAQTHTFNGTFSGTTQVSRYQKGKTNLDFTGARDNEWQWHQLGCVQVCTSFQTDNHTSTPPLSFFYRPDALPAPQPTASKHCRNNQSTEGTKVFQISQIGMKLENVPQQFTKLSVTSKMI